MAINYTQLTIKERYNLEFLIQEGYTNFAIAEKLGRHKSTISRELKRNNISTRKEYSAEAADKMAKYRCINVFFSRFTPLAKDKIRELLELKWTPEQISSYLKNYNVTKASHELIYQYINDNRNAGGNLYKLLPHRGQKYKKRNIKTRKRIWKAAAKRKSISTRPAKAVLKTEIGHWEGDTVESKGHHGGIATIVDIKSKFTIMRKVNDKTSIEMKNAIIDSFINCSEIIKTLTVDNGNEFARHDEISSELNAKVYFAAPYSPWQRGLNENTNGLIRRFYPKGTDFTKVSERELLRVQDLLNNRPRKTLGFKTPTEVFTEELLKNEKYKEVLKAI